MLGGSAAPLGHEGSDQGGGGGGGGTAGTQVFLAINSLGIIQSVGKSVWQMFGYTEDEVIGRNVAMLMPDPYRSYHDLYLARYMRTGIKRIMTGGWRSGAQGVQAVDKSGQVFDVRISISAVVVDTAAPDCVGLAQVACDCEESSHNKQEVEDGDEVPSSEAILCTPPPAGHRSASSVGSCPVTGVTPRSSAGKGDGCPFTDRNNPERYLTPTQELHFVGLLEKVSAKTLRISLDGNLSIMSANNECQSIFGCAPHDLMGQHIARIVPMASDKGGLEKFVKTDVLREDRSSHTMGIAEGGAGVPIDITVTKIPVSDTIPLSKQRAYYCEITDLRREDLSGALVCTLDGVVEKCNSNTMPVLGLSMLDQSMVEGSHISRFLVGLEDFKQQLQNGPEGELMCTCLSGRCLVSAFYHVLDHDDIDEFDGGKCMVNIKFAGPKRNCDDALDPASGSVNPGKARALDDSWKKFVRFRPVDALHAYEIEQLIGRGAFGCVYRAIHRVSGREVAIKEISAKRMSAKNISREIENHQLVGGHPNIITAYISLQSGDNTYLIQELAKGPEMFDYVASCPDGVLEAEARVLFAQIFSAVDYMHRKGVVHRDLKLENVLFSDKRVPKITDFGLSNRQVSQTFRMDTFCGSPAYAAPEIYGKLKYEGTLVDMWSLGVMLYTCIVGSYPYEDDKPPTPGSPLPPIPQKISPLCADLLRKLLASESSKRITAAESIVHPWLLHPVFRWPTRIIYRRFATSPSVVREIDAETTEAVVPIDENVVSDMLKRGYSPLMVYSSLNSGFFDQPGTTYKLMARPLVPEDFLQCAEVAPTATGRPSDRRNASAPLVTCPSRLEKSVTSTNLLDAHCSAMASCPGAPVKPTETPAGCRESAALKNSGLGRHDIAFVAATAARVMREVQSLPDVTRGRSAVLVYTLCAELRQRAAEAGWSAADDQNVPLKDLTLGQ